MIRSKRFLLDLRPDIQRHRPTSMVMRLSLKALAIDAAEQFFAQLDHPASISTSTTSLTVLCFSASSAMTSRRRPQFITPHSPCHAPAWADGEHVGIGAFIPAVIWTIHPGHHTAIGHVSKMADVLELALFVRQHLGHLHALGRSPCEGVPEPGRACAINTSLANCDTRAPAPGAYRRAPRPVYHASDAFGAHSAGLSRVCALSRETLS